MLNIRINRVVILLNYTQIGSPWLHQTQRCSKLIGSKADPTSVCLLLSIIFDIIDRNWKLFCLQSTRYLCSLKSQISDSRHGRKPPSGRGSQGNSTLKKKLDGGITIEWAAYLQYSSKKLTYFTWLWSISILVSKFAICICLHIKIRWNTCNTNLETKLF